MVALLLLLASSPGRAESLRVTLRVEDERLELVSAVQLAGDAHVPAGDLEVLDAEGNLLGTAALPPLVSHRSVLAPDGSETARVDSPYLRVLVPWSADARSVRLGASTVEVAGDARLRREPVTTPAVPVQESGPSADRLDLVFLAEGYPAEREDVFADRVDEVVDHLFEIEPWSGYTGLVNVWRLFTPAPARGIDRTEGDDTLDTPFECFYGCGLAGVATSRLICCDEEEILAFIDANAPFADGIMVLVDADEDPADYGGSGGLTYSTSYTGDALLQVASHELGHTLIGLWDEYPYGIPADPATTYLSPNCSPQGTQVVWEEWLEGGPIEWFLWHQVQERKATQPFRFASVDCDGRDGAAAFDAICAYPTCSFTDWVRPTRGACMMNQLGDSYCPVCREAIVRSLYRALGDSLVLSADPPVGDRVVLDEDQRVRFAVDAVGPDDGLLWTWTHQDRVLHVGPDFTLDGSARVCGDLTLTLTDPTSWVRADLDGRLTEQVTWRVRTGPCCGGCSSGGLPLGAPALVAALATLRRRRSS